VQQHSTKCIKIIISAIIITSKNNCDNTKSPYKKTDRKKGRERERERGRKREEERNTYLKNDNKS